MKADQNGNSLHGFKRPNSRQGEHVTADWSSCNPKLLVEVITQASQKACAVRFGYTRDGGAYSVGVYLGDDYFTDYIRPDEDIDLYLETLGESFREFVRDETPPPSKKSNRRA